MSKSNRISISVSDEVLTKLDLEAARLGTTRGAMVVAWIGEKLNQIEQQRLLMENLYKPEHFSKVMGELMEYLPEEMRKTVLEKAIETPTTDKASIWEQSTLDLEKGDAK